MKNDELEGVLEWLKTCGNNDYIFETGNSRILLNHINNLQQERDKFKLRCFKVYKMIFDNYGVLDKYQIDLMEDILEGKEDE